MRGKIRRLKIEPKNILTLRGQRSKVKLAKKTENGKEEIRNNQVLQVFF